MLGDEDDHNYYSVQMDYLDNLLAFAQKLGYETEERDYTLDELMNADEIIVHSTGSFALPVAHVDGKPVGGKAPEMLKRIQDALVADFEEQCKPQ